MATEPMDHLVWSREHNAWWASKRCGYRTDVLVAGVYTKTEAEQIAADSRGNEQAFSVAEVMGRARNQSWNGAPLAAYLTFEPESAPLSPATPGAATAHEDR